MSISPISSPCCSLIDQAQGIAEATTVVSDKVHQQLATLHMMTQKLIGPTAPGFCKIIEELDQNRIKISYSECEELFVEGFIQEFNTEQIEIFLDHFFHALDPKKEIIELDKTSTHGRFFLWKNIINYYCCHYIQFSVDCMGLKELFETFQKQFDTKLEASRPLDHFNEATLEKRFYHATDIIPEFTEDEIVQTKLMLIHYAALLIEALKLSEKNEEISHFITGETMPINELFEDIYMLLLEISPFEVAPSTLSHDVHQLLDYLDPRDIQEAFIEKLIQILTDPQDKDVSSKEKTIRSVMSSCEFIDFKIKDYLERMILGTP